MKSLCLMLLLVSASAAAQNMDAKRIYFEAELAFQSGRFDVAADRFAEAHALYPQPSILFDLAQACRRQLETSAKLPAEQVMAILERAISSYRAFLAVDPSSPRAPVARKFAAELSRTQELILKQGERERVQLVEREVQVMVERNAWQRDRAGAALAVSGAALTIIGVGLLAAGGASVRERDAPGNVYGRFEEFDSRARAELIAGGMTLGVGVVLLVSGGVRYVLKHRRDGSLIRLAAVRP